MLNTVSKYIIRRIKFGEVVSVGVVGINDTELGLLEKLHLGGAVVGEGFVVIKVFVGEVGKNGDLDRDTESAKLGQGVGSGLEDKKLGAGVSDGADALVEDGDAFGGHVFVLLV